MKQIYSHSSGAKEAEVSAGEASLIETGGSGSGGIPTPEGLSAALPSSASVAT